MNVYRALAAPAQFTVKAIAIVAIAGILTAFGVEHARLRMEREAARQRVCRAELAALTARNLFVERYVRPSDPCLALEVAAR